MVVAITFQHFWQSSSNGTVCRFAQIYNDSGTSRNERLINMETGELWVDYCSRMTIYGSSLGVLQMLQLNLFLP